MAEDKFSHARRWIVTEAVDLAVRSKQARRILLKLGHEKSRRFHADDSVHGIHGKPEIVREMRHLAITNLLTSLSNALADGRISPRMRRGLIKNFVGQVVTDSTTLGDPLDANSCNVFALLKLFADAEELERIEDWYRAGARDGAPFGYGHAKQLLAGHIERFFAPARARHEHLTAHP